MINPIVRGWMNYYGAFYPSALSTLLARINTYLMRWVRKKYSRFREASPAGVAVDHRAVSAILRTLGLDHSCPRRLVTRMTRAV